jgi:PhnB protein
MKDVALPKLKPLLVVRDAPAAIDFYVRAFGATEIARFMNTRSGSVSHADLRVGTSSFSVTEEARAWNSDAPPSLGGSPVVLELQVDDVDAAFDRVLNAGAAVVFPLTDFCGERMARLRDPFGHIWIVSQTLEEMSVAEKQRRRDAWAPPGRPSKT